MTAPITTQPAAIGPRPESPVMSLFKQWLDLGEAKAKTFRETGEDDLARETASDNMISAEKQIVATVSVSHLDWIAKISAASNFGLFDVDPELRRQIWAEARAFLDQPSPAEVLALGLHAAPMPEPGPMMADSRSGADTAILRLFLLHTALRGAAAAYTSATMGADGPPELDEQLYQVTERIEAEMMALPSTCAGDMAAKMIMAHAGGELSCLPADAAVWVEARKLTGIEL